MPATVDGRLIGSVPRKDYQMFLTHWSVSTKIDSTNDASNYVSFDLQWLDYNDTETSISPANFDTSADNAGEWTDHSIDIYQVFDTTNAFAVVVGATFHHAAGPGHILSVLNYRLIIT
jgi:hypothetical protein